jgi:hypothetical protein
LRSWGLLGEYLRHAGNALVADPDFREGRGVGIPDSALCPEDACDLLPGLAAELADDRGRVKGLYDLWLVVVGMEVCLFVPEGVDIVVVMGLLGSFHRPPPIACGPPTTVRPSRDNGMP